VQRKSAASLRRDCAKVRRGSFRASQSAELVSDEHFTVEGTLIEAWASYKSIKPKDENRPPSESGKNPTIDFKGTKRHPTSDCGSNLFPSRFGDGEVAALAR